MFFNSLEFAIFIPIVFIMYWFVAGQNLKARNVVLLASSYFFYGWWDWRFLSLIFFSTIIDFIIGLYLSKAEKNRKILLLISIIVNLGFLGFFKYYNFFADNFANAFTFFGRNINTTGLNIILPVGISFYTFQTLSYSIDIYKKKMKPTNDFIAFSAFVSFFPQLVAGPIERATNLLPQFYSKQIFRINDAKDGLRQILWGLFKKIVIADNCASYVNDIFQNNTEYTGSTLMIGAILFAFQIYGDFSGYSDIAIGTARLFGFKLMRNFNYPYFSRDMAEFWRRWHISLSSWFRDYLYIPLGGSKGGKIQQIRNTFIIFIVSGFWHGANWTFVAWGALNAVFFLPLLIVGQNRKHTNHTAQNTFLPSLKELSQIITTFILTSLAWIFFRAQNIHHATEIYKSIFSKSLLTKPQVFEYPLIIFISLLLLIEWVQRKNEHGLMFKAKSNINKPFRWAFYLLIIAIIFFYGNYSSTYEFIYFQF